MSVRDALPVGRGVAALREHGLWLTALLSVAVFLGLFLFGDAAAVAAAVASVRPRTVLALLALATTGYAVRFLKWEYYLRTLGVAVPLRASALTFYAGLMLVVTPAKVGEVWKAWFLRDLAGVPASTTAPAVGAERVTDLLALTAMASLGVVLFRRSPAVLLAVGAVLAGGIAVLQWRTLCLRTLSAARGLPVVGEHAAELREFYEGAYALFRPRPLAVAVAVSLLAWGLEGLGLWLLLSDLGVAAGPALGLSAFGLGSVVGAASLLPGGLAAAEASMVGVLVAAGVGRAAASAATLVVRVGTLWYGAALGTVVFAIHRLRRGRS